MFATKTSPKLFSSLIWSETEMVMAPIRVEGLDVSKKYRAKELNLY
ncbi:hypothetical protein [Dyadobacter sp. CY312]|nr:hypothetical protein [Dyadobacter sp. CY312]MCE7042751.1 hypothetical protein [Dyadobacter sp. CY312]